MELSAWVEPSAHTQLCIKTTPSFIRSETNTSALTANHHTVFLIDSRLLK